MPFFADGEDPRLTPGQNPGLRMPMGQPASDPFAGPSPSDTVGAAFRESNPIASVLSAVAAQSPDRSFDPAWNPLSVVRGTKYEQSHLDSFIGDMNEAQTRARMAKIDREEEDRKTLAASGWGGTIASVGAGMLDPTMYLPIFGEIGMAREGAVLARSAARLGGMGALQSGVSEAALQASQQTRTWGESAGNIASNTLLMGILGGAIGTLSLHERTQAVRNLDEVRPKVGVDPATGEATVHAPSEPPGISVFHGSPKKIDTLDSSQFGPGVFGEGFGHYTSANERIAGGYADPRVPLEERGKGGYVYQAKISRDPDHFIDWNTGFEGQSPYVKERLTDLGLADAKPKHDIFPDTGRGYSYGARFYEEMVRRTGSTEAAARALSDAGIAGTKYFDTAIAKRLDLEDVSANHNYVVFNDSDVQLTHRNGKPITQPAPPANENIETPIARAVGAAVSDERTLKPVSYGLEKLPVVGQWFKNTSPTQRVFWNDVSVTARRAMADLAETPLIFEDNRAGIATNAGGSLERDVKQAKNRLFLDGSDTLQKGFVEHRYGDTAPSAPIARAAASDLMGRAEGKMSYGEFKESVYDALYSGDTHADPIVARTAQELRAKVFDPVKKAAVDAGLFSEDAVQPKGDQSFAPRHWNREAVAARRPEVRRIFTDWLAGEQETKAAAQGRIAQLQRGMDESGARIKELQKKIDQLPEYDKLRADHEYDVRIEQEKQATLRASIEGELQEWAGKSSMEAKAALKERAGAETERATKQASGAYRGPGERLTGADSAVDRAVERILGSDRNLPREELASRADEIIDRILGSPDGRLNYDIANGGPRLGPPRGSEPPPRGSLHSREFAIPTASVRDFVERDLEHVMQSFLRTVLPDVALTSRFGDVEMRDVFRKINEEFAARAESLAGDEKALRTLEKERLGVIRDVAAVRDRIRGVYGWTPDYTARQMGRLARAASNYNSLTGLGTAMLNSMGDLAGAVFRYGFVNVLHDAWAPFFGGMLRMSELAPAAKRNARALMIAIETDTNLRHHQLNDITEAFRPGSKFERGLQWASNKMQLVNGQAWFTDRVKAMAATVAQAEILRHAEKVAKGTASEKELQRLASASIDRATAERIWNEFSDGGGEVIDGTPLANSADWKNKSAARAFENAIARETDIAVVTPGQEKPLWMSKPVAGLLGQFKSFVAATHERTLLAQLQQRDARSLQGLVAAVATGMLSYRLYTLVSGQPVSDKPQDWIKEGINRSGVIGWFDEINSMTAKATGGKADIYRMVGADKPLSRYQSRSILSTFGGPTAGKIQDASAVVRALVTREGSAADVKSGRQLIPFQNLFAVRPLFNQLEAGVNSAFGFPVQPPKH